MDKKFLLALDLEEKEQAIKIVNFAKEIGGNDAVYQVLSVLPPLGGSMVASFLPKGYDHKLLQNLQSALHSFTEQYLANLHVKHIVAHGSIYDEINRLAETEKSDFIIIAAGKDGTLGPNSARVARYSSRSVFIIR